MKLYPWWAVVWAMLPAAAMKLAQELDDSAMNLQTDSVSSGLLARASTALASDDGMNTSRDGSLDTVAAKKNPFKFVGSIANTVKDAGRVVADAGLEMGKAAANRAVVIGNGILESPRQSLQEVGDVLLPDVVVVGPALEVRNVFDAVRDPGQIVVAATVDLGSGIVDEVRQSLQDAANRGLVLADQVGGVLQPFVGTALDAVGPLAAGLPGDDWNRLRGFVDCLQDTDGGGRRPLCEMLIGRDCDCSGGSYVRPSTGGVQMKCIFKATSVFAKGYGIRATGSVDSSGETTLDANVLPGEEFEQAHRMHNQALRLRETVRQNQGTMRDVQRDLARGRQRSLSDYQKRQPAGSCEGSLSVAVDGVIQWTSPEVELDATAETTTFTVRGMVRASMDALVTAEGSCSYKASKGFPKNPKTKTFCAKAFCIVLALQMVATLEVSGTLTGTVETSHDADFLVVATGSVRRDGLGKARDVQVEVSSPQLQHQEGWAVGVSASASVKLSAGPQLVVWPMPGVPITFHPAIHAEAKAIGTVFYLQEPQRPGWAGGWALIEQSANTSSNMTSVRQELQDFAKATPQLPLCGAAAMTIYSDFGVTGFNLPPPLREIMDSDFLARALADGMAEGAKAMMTAMTGPAQCGGSHMRYVVNRAADVAAKKLKGLISALGLPWQFPLVQLLNPQRLFCAVVYTIPADKDEFNSRPCAQDLGCKTAGQVPPPPSEEAATVPPENVHQTPQRTEAAPTCHNLPMGDGFIELGAFRLGVTGHGHHGHERLVIAHRNGLVPVFWTEHGHVEHGPHKWDHGLWTRWPVPGGAANIKFGFQFIQIGDFRIGAVDDHHFSIAHRRTMMTAVIYTADGVTHPGHNHRRDWNVLDRPEGPPAGLTFGERFVQFGKFRIGDTDGHHFYLMSPRKHFISLFLGDGGVNSYRPGVAHEGLLRLQQNLLREPVADWTCPDLGELAHGNCSASWGGWGDRFLQLGNWRLGALDTSGFVTRTA
ncbi:UVR8 [Symbiodinium sp. CCMP2456]|nr:UVR8 [Symbiodinium sp. CCMP2456]